MKVSRADKVCTMAMGKEMVGHREKEVGDGVDKREISYACRKMKRKERAVQGYERVYKEMGGVCE